MQTTSMFLKRGIRLSYFTIILSGANLFYCWMFEYTCLATILCFFIFVVVWFYITRNCCKPIGRQDAIVITGCDSGLGYSLALHCHEYLNVHVIAGIHNEHSQGSRDLIKIGIIVHPLDITHKESINTFVQFVNARLKKKNLTLRGVVNNAGSMIFGEFEWLTDEQIYQQINVNLLGTMRLTKAMMSLIREHCSRLIIVTSHCANESLPGVATYGATKAGLAAWATSLRVELKKYNVDVVNFIPGSFIQESNLVSQQRTQFEVMESAMLPKTKQFYSEYFRRYADYLSVLSHNKSPVKLNNSKIYEIFDDALLHRYPRPIYKCEPWRYTFYYALFKITPTHVRDWLVDKFMQMPTWREENNIVRTNN